MVSALLLLIFAAGLRRRLAEQLPAGSLLPRVAASGLLLVSVAQLMGTALTTEFVFGLQNPGDMVPEAALGVITTIFGLSPLQYMAGVTGTIWLTVAAFGLLRKP